MSSFWKTCRQLSCADHIKRACFSTTAKYLLPVKVGDRLPSINLYENSPDNAVNIADVFKGKKGVLFSVVGAFTPGCSQAHVPEYLNNYEKFKEEGYEEIVCVAVNDPFVMAAWGKQVECEGKIRMLADPRAELANSIDMVLDCEKLLGNKRSKRYSLLIDDGIVTHANMNPDSSGLACLLCIRNMKGNSHSFTANH